MSAHLLLLTVYPNIYVYYQLTTASVVEKLRYKKSWMHEEFSFWRLKL